MLRLFFARGDITGTGLVAVFALVMIAIVVTIGAM